MFPSLRQSCFTLFFSCCAFHSANSAVLPHSRKSLYLREQDTGQGLHFIEGDSGAVVRKIVSDTCYLMSKRVILTLMDITGILECSRSSDLSIAGGPKSVKVLWLWRIFFCFQYLYSYSIDRDGLILASGDQFDRLCVSRLGGSSTFPASGILFLSSVT